MPWACARESTKAPILRFWSTTTLASPPARSSMRSMSPALFLRSSLNTTLPQASRAHALCAVFPTSTPRTKTGCVWAADMVYPLPWAGRRRRKRHPHYLAVAAESGARHVSISRFPLPNPPRWQHPPGLLMRQGQRAIRGGRSTTVRTAQSYCFQRKEPSFADGSNCNGQSSPRALSSFGSARNQTMEYDGRRETHGR